jgi:ribosomal peptide maturation radical SAM protein 1
MLEDHQIAPPVNAISRDGMAQVCLVNMPYCPITRPSLALGVLKACLDAAGISCAVEYANLRFVDLIGMDLLRVVATSRDEHLVGEWTFGAAAFPEFDSTIEEAIGVDTVDRMYKKDAGKAEMLKAMLELWRGVRELAPSFVDDIARRVLARRPRIVGCTSTFEQQAASLALLRRVKELDPSVVTMLGGANCEAEMGWAVVQEFPWVDFVVSGEADEIFAPLCKLAIKKGANIDPLFLPQGVMSAAHVKANTYGPGRARVPRAVVERLDVTPVPNFDDYFNTLEQSSVRKYVVPALPIETSRGCWWGQKSHCTFCGLNGEGMRFRAKNTERVLQEFDALASRYEVDEFQVADNILDMHHLRTVMPALEQAGAPYKLFYEIKANLRREQVAALAAAGVTRVQPGIESLNDNLLKLMAKGSTAAINIELLKHTRQYGIGTVWLLLVSFPGEEDSWHHQVAAWIPLLHHLEPAAEVAHIRYDRFSVYHSNPAAHNLDLTPFPAYSRVYPTPPERLKNLAYFFRDRNSPILEETSGITAMRASLKQWNQVFDRNVRPVLCSDDKGDAIHIYDTRSIAPARRVTLMGLEAEAYRACDPAISRDALRKRLTAGGTVTEAEADAAIASLEARLIVLDTHSKLVALCIPGDIAQPKGLDQAPGGWVVGIEDPMPLAIARARERLRELQARIKSMAPALVN